MYLIISPKDSILTHSTNTVYEFISELPKEIELEGKWVCGLVECDLDPKPKTLYMYCDIVQNSIVQGQLKPILKILTEKNEFNQICYFPVTRSRLHRIRISIRTKEDQLPTSRISDCFMIIHFKRIKA